ncbi:NAD-binding protein [Trujillonella humicola]|uniref:NAD-binding protein n=1 Tax=Trujillonella humicola TaxID=3383699 RepID=UPI0039060C79
MHFGPLGSGQRVKLINNLLFGAHVQLAIEAARIAGSFGLDAGLLARTLHTGSGQSYALDLVAATGSAQALLEGAGPYVRKDVRVADRVAADLGVPLGTIGAATRPLLDP